LRILGNDLTTAIIELNESAEVKQGTPTEDSSEAFDKVMKELLLELGPNWSKKPVIYPANVNKEILVTDSSKNGYLYYDVDTEVR